MKRWIVPILILPFTMMIVVPSAILWMSRNCACAGAAAPLASLSFWGALALAVPGLALAGSSMRMFFRHGDGTAAPWDPPVRLVVRGPYRHVRNPMLSGVILVLFAEAIFFQSWPLGAWASVFFLGNAVYFPLKEEPVLRKRFGADYETYSKHVPRWVPRLKGWDGMKEE